MPGMRIFPVGDGQLDEFKDRRIVELEPERIVFVGLPKGMKSGRASVAFFVDQPDGRPVYFIQNSMANFIKLAVVMHARYEEEWRKEGVVLEVTLAPKGTE